MVPHRPSEKIGGNVESIKEISNSSDSLSKIMEVREWQMGLEYVVVSNRTKFTLRV